MDVTALATAFIGAKAAEVQMAVAAKMLRMNADAAKSVVQVIEAAQENLNRLAKSPPASAETSIFRSNSWSERARAPRRRA